MVRLRILHVALIPCCVMPLCAYALDLPETCKAALGRAAALLLSTNFANADAVHPVSGASLDDYRSSFTQFKDLVAVIDTTFKSRLGIIGNNPIRPIAG